MDKLDTMFAELRQTEPYLEDRGFARAHDLIADGAVLDRVLAV